GYFYGTTARGGASGNGTVFRMDTRGALTTLVSFAGTNGSYSQAALVQGRDGYFYGTTASGGPISTNISAGSAGTVFRMGTNGGLTTLFSFSSLTGGRFPWAGLVQGSDGYFYGTTHEGGPGGGGTVFRFRPDPQIVTQPASQFAVADSTVTFSVAAQGTMPLGYQWLFNGHPLGSATNATLTLNNVS